MVAKDFHKDCLGLSLGWGQKGRPLGLSAAIEKNEAALMKRPPLVANCCVCWEGSCL